jgi:hypothetical protein
MRYLIAVTALALCLAGCGRKNETTITGADGEKMTISADSSGNNATIKTDKGSITANTGSTGAVFPVGAPQYPGSTITGNMSFSGMDQGKGNSKTITSETTATPAEVAAFYKAKMAEAKLPITSEMTTQETAMLTSGDASGKNTVSIMASVDSGKTSIIVSEVKQ